MAVPLEVSARDARALADNWDAVRRWIYEHAELCEEPDALRKLERNAARVSELVGKIKDQK